MIKALRSFLVGYGLVVVGGLSLITGLLLFQPGLMRTIFARNGFTPHGYCLLWDPNLVWLYVVSDTLIGMSYVAISFLLAYLVHRARRDIPFHRVFLAFGVFIIACGSTHFMNVWTLWTPTYYLAGGLKLLTAVASVATAVALPPFLPRTLAMIGEAKVSNHRKQHLEAAHVELEALYRKTAELDRLKTQFFANVSHELRTPLTLILGPTQQLLATDGLTAEQKESLALIERNARTLLQRVNDLLDVAKLDAGKLELHPSELDLAALVRRVAAHFEGVAAERSLTFSVETPPSTPAQLDVDKLERICFNLLGNAVKFTPDGGAIRCCLSTQDGQAVITVEDTGPGIPPELRAVIFEPFRQGDGGATRRFGGTGLGLAITKDFVALHGGTIQIEDAPSGGARFAVTLPLQVGTVAEQPIAPERALAGGPSPAVLVEQAADETSALAPRPTDDRPVVLVVEDNAEMRRFVAESLAPSYNVITANNGRQGVDQALAVPPDVILSDIMMPGLSGDQLVAVLRQQPELAAVPIMMLTARAGDELKVQLLRSGAQDYLVKPFSVAELSARVANLVAVKRTRDVLQQALHSNSADLEQLARELAARRGELEQAVHLRDEFLSIASHELKTPVTSLLGYAELLERRWMREGNASERDRRGLHVIVEQARRLDTLITALLDVSRMEHGSFALELRPVDLVAVARRVVAEMQPAQVQHTLTLDTRLDHLLVAGDELRLAQALGNLLQNAVKYSPGGGPITVTLEPADQEARLSVSDCGIGIPSAARTRLFDRFYRADNVDTQQISGFGIGLYVVNQIVSLHGGRIEVESSEGIGTTLHIFLPKLGQTQDEQGLATLSKA